MLLYFENILIGDNNRMISTGEFKTVEINNITFINANGQYISDTTNYILIIIIETIISERKIAENIYQF